MAPIVVALADVNRRLTRPQEYEYPQLTILEHRATEMKGRNSLRDAFFGLKRETQRRPVSVATEFVDTDFDDEEDILTDFEEPGDNSPRASLHSVSPPLCLWASVGGEGGSADICPSPESAA